MRVDGWGTRLLGSMVVLAGTAGPATAQQASAPKLQSRSNSAAILVEKSSTNATEVQPSTLPPDASGAYHSNTIDKSVEIDIVRGKLSGYVSQLGDAETDSNTPLTFFFDQTSVNGPQLSFETRVVHGIWYSFRGSISRGNGVTRADEGYYVLHGVLEEHHPENQEDKSANETIEKLTIRFKSVRQ